MQSDSEIRNKVEWFSGLMEMNLKRNAHKNGWQECSLLWLTTKLIEEAGELGRILVNELYSPEGDYVSIGDANSNPVLRAALFETADIANIALMIGDLVSEGMGSRRKGRPSVVLPPDIRQLRRAAGLTLGEVSEKMGISVSYLSDIERNPRGYTITEKVRRVIDYLAHAVED